MISSERVFTPRLGWRIMRSPWLRTGFPSCTNAQQYQTWLLKEVLSGDSPSSQTNSALSTGVEKTILG